MPEDPDKNNSNSDNSNNRSNMPQNNDWDNESNPFVAFRRFADEQVSSVLQSITGLPSSISPPQSDNWTIFTDDKGYKSMAYRHRSGSSSANNAADRDSTQNPGGNSTPNDGEDDSSNNSNNNGQNPPSRSQQPPRSENTQQPPQPPSLNRQRHEHRPSDFFGLDSFFDRFEDRFFPFASSFFHPHQNFFSTDMFNDGSPTWPLTYVMLSPYSPLHLERQAHYRMHRDQGVFSSIMSSLRFDLDSESTRDPSEPQWREAFEDLLRLENGKPMLDRDSLATTKSRPENGIEWVHGLVKRGSLGDQWKYVSGTDRHPWTGITFSGYNEENEESRDRDQPEPNTKALESQAAHDEAEAETELELYERFLQDIEAREREFSQEIASSPLLRALLEEQQRRRNVFEKYERGWPSDDEQGNDDTESWLDLVSGGHRKSVPETNDAPPSVPTPAREQQAVVASENHTARVVSTMINTERTRLPDGSVQTKKVTTKRYEDGREETESLTETTHPRNEDGSSNDQNSGPKNGWFWKD